MFYVTVKRPRSEGETYPPHHHNKKTIVVFTPKAFEVTHFTPSKIIRLLGHPCCTGYNSKLELAAPH